MVTFYIARSIDEKITKVGITQDLRTRIKSLKHSDKVEFILVYESPKLHRERGLGLEKAVFKEFKEDVIQGKERFSTHPLKIISFVQEEVKKFRLDWREVYDINLNTTYDYRQVGYKKANGINMFDKNVLTNSKFVSFIHMFAEGKLRTFEFANIYDAVRTTLLESHRVNSYRYIPKLLFGMQREDYYETLSRLKGECAGGLGKESIYLPFDYKPSN